MGLAGGRDAFRHFDDAVDDRRRHGQDGRLHGAVPFLAAQEDGQVEVQAGEERERMARVDGHGGDDRIDFPFKEAFQPEALVVIEGIDADEVQAAGLQFALDIGIIAVLIGDELMDHGLDGIELFLRRHTGDIDMVDAAFDEVLDAGNADHEEFIQVGRGDGDEVQLFQKRIGRHDGFTQDAFVEFDPRTFTIQKILTVCKICHDYLILSLTS